MPALPKPRLVLAARERGGLNYTSTWPMDIEHGHLGRAGQE